MKVMQMEFSTIFNEKINTSCAGCIVADNSKFKDGRIYQSNLWDLSQDFEIAYPGMVILSPLRHVSNYMDLTENELKELNFLLLHCKKMIIEFLNCENIVYTFYEKPNGHIHFVIIPFHGLIEIKDKYSVLRELMNRAHELKNDNKNMLKVVEIIEIFRRYFQTI